MDPQLEELLSLMRDVHEPAQISWWPLAFGWWVLLALVIVAIAGLLYLFVYRRRHNSFRVEALAQLEQAYRLWRERQLDGPFLASCAQLTRRLALQRLPRSEVAPIAGDAWRQTLVALSAHSLQPSNLDALLNEQYRANPRVNAEDLYQDMKQFIQLAGRKAHA